MHNYHRTSTKRSSFRPKKILLGTIVVCLVSAGLWALDYKNIINLPFISIQDEQSVDETSTNNINYGPPTEEERKETENFKENQGQQVTPPTTPTSTSQKKAVTPIISFSGQNATSKAVEASGYAPVVESGGTCTLTLKKAGQAVSESKQATADAQTTSCGLITISRSRLSSGSWTATISYSSSLYEGTSNSVKIEVE